jgi:ribosomal protein L7Ae-like RNA K-turn-binding protein
MFDKQIKTMVAIEVEAAYNRALARLREEQVKGIYALDPKKMHMVVVKDDETAIELKKQIESFIKQHGLKVVIVASEGMNVISF